jgi:hypothetical protein
MHIIVATFAGAGGCLGIGYAEPEPGELASTGPAAVLRARRQSLRRGMASGAVARLAGEAGLLPMWQPTGGDGGERNRAMPVNSYALGRGGGSSTPGG